ncbi:carbon-nitrogen hydrolase family protein [Kribbella deserti]|uniref:Carbon-nitrogen hydrolase family protein n=1 Tax=Kribbella deserti TaxID=1926257 RepID=A0ABV6QJT6_9ACTN
MPEFQRLRFAVAQSTVHEDPRDRSDLRERGDEIRRLMREAAVAGARLVHFPEGATCFPSKFVMSVNGPDEVGPADWSRFEWDVVEAELNAIAALAKQLRLWTVLGSVHQLTAPRRPHNSLYVISDQGRVHTRYDERTLSHTKVTWMYTPGSEPVTFEVDGLRFGCALGMDVHFPELFREYERLGVDCVLVSFAGGNPYDKVSGAEAQGHAATNSYWVSYAVPAQHGKTTPSGVISPQGDWVARCPDAVEPAIAVTELDRGKISQLAREWRRRASAEFPERVPVDHDARSNDRSAF